MVDQKSPDQIGLKDKKSHKNILIYEISDKTLVGPKPLRVKLDKMDGFIRIYDGNRYLTLLSSRKYDAIYNRTRYLISVKSSVTYLFSHYLAKIKIDSYDSLSIEKALTTQNVIMLIKSVLNKDKHHYLYKIF